MYSFIVHIYPLLCCMALYMQIAMEKMLRINSFCFLHFNLRYTLQRASPFPPSIFFCVAYYMITFVS
ncbi:hypothetical protein RIF29_38914 [Crotalaria pallida]|uniref:Uncharacterized protein n=1 Tax=Crotalaria pallida TaxID=3830 RepID=A0AAN9HPC7_CROPI